MAILKNLKFEESDKLLTTNDNEDLIWDDKSILTEDSDIYKKWYKHNFFQATSTHRQEIDGLYPFDGLYCLYNFDKETSTSTDITETEFGFDSETGIYRTINAFDFNKALIPGTYILNIKRDTTQNAPVNDTTKYGTRLLGILKVRYITSAFAISNNETIIQEFTLIRSYSPAKQHNETYTRCFGIDYQTKEPKFEVQDAWLWKLIGEGGTSTGDVNATATTQPTTDSSSKVATTAYVKNVASAYLPISGGTVTGETTFENNLNLENDNPRFRLVNTSVERGVAPIEETEEGTTNHNTGYSYLDKNGNVLGENIVRYKSDGALDTVLRVFKPEITEDGLSDNHVELRVGYNSEGVPFAMAPNPTEVTDSSTRIATTKWVNNFVNSTYLHLSGGTMTGAITFDLPTDDNSNEYNVFATTVTDTTNKTFDEFVIQNSSSFSDSDCGISIRSNINYTEDTPTDIESLSPYITMWGKRNANGNRPWIKGFVPNGSDSYLTIFNAYLGNHCIATMVTPYSTYVSDVKEKPNFICTIDTLKGTKPVSDEYYGIYFTDKTYSTETPHRIGLVETKLTRDREEVRMELGVECNSLRMTENSHKPVSVEIFADEIGNLTNSYSEAKTYSIGYIRCNNIRRLITKEDNTASLGDSSNKWTTLYATTGTINTSDRRCKSDIQDYTDEFLDAWGDINWCTFKFNDSIKQKGEENARTHAGIIAQDVISAFEKYGIEPEKYSFFCHDDIEQTEENQDDELKDIYSIRYSEALSIEAAYQRRRANRLEKQVEYIKERNKNLEERLMKLEQIILSKGL